MPAAGHLERLPFRQVWAVDFEFEASPGERPVPVCLVARELRSGELLRIWQDELRRMRLKLGMRARAIAEGFLRKFQLPRT